MSPDKNFSRAAGTALGILLIIIWLAFLWFAGRTIFPHQSFTQNPVITWLYIGSVLFLFLAGDYLMYRRKLGGAETTCATVELKSFLLGFLLWLFAMGVLVSFMQWDVPYLLNGLGGLLTMAVVYLLWKRSATRRNPHANAGQE